MTVRKLLSLALGSAVVCGLLVSVGPLAEAAAPVTVRGRVTDLGGAPISGLEVHVTQPLRGGPYSIANGTTDSSGRYRFTFSTDDIDNPPRVMVWPSDFATASRAVGSLPGRTYTIDLALRRLPAITGHVVNADGEPAVQVSVEYHNTAPGGDCPGGVFSGSDGDECADWNDLYLNETGRNGTFGRTIRHGDVYSVVLRDEYHARYETTVVHNVAAGDHIDVEMPPKIGSTDIEPVTVTGIVTDEAGEPVAGVEVAAIDPDTELEVTLGLLHDTIATATTDDVGGYELSFDPLTLDNFEKRIVVQVDTPDGYVEWPIGDAAYYDPGSTIVADIPLGPPATISGTVRDADSNPIPGAEVCCGIDGPTTTDSEGEYFLDVPAGFGILVVDDLPWSTTEYVVQPGANADVDIDFRLPPPVEPNPPAPEPDITRPAPPQQVTAAVLGPHRVKVRFHPAYSGGRPITEFRAECIGNRAKTRTTRDARPPLIVKRLAPDHRYRCRVRGHNTLGWGPWSTYSPGVRTPRR